MLACAVCATPFARNWIMNEQPFPQQDEKDRKGGQHGTQPSDDPQLKKIHESTGSDDELGRGNDTSIEDGGSRHRQQ